MNKLTVKEETEYGLAKQAELFDTINTFFGGDLKETTYKYAKYDFYSDNCIYELKSRKCKLEDYKETLLPFSKIIKGKNKQIFIFNFENGLYYIEYSKELFDTFDVRPFKRNSLFDKDFTEKPYIYIPTNKLSKIIV